MSIFIKNFHPNPNLQVFSTNILPKSHFGITLNLVLPPIKKAIQRLDFFSIIQRICTKKHPQILAAICTW